jgi:hypothetical protein
MAEPLAVLLLPARLEEFDRAPHARGLLAIPRVVALEPPRLRAPRLLGQAGVLRQARRLRFPGQPRAFVLYDPVQYPLVRALCARHRAELWYVPPESPDPAEEWRAFDALAREWAVGVIDSDAGIETPMNPGPLRVRLRELEVINPRPFAPGGRLGRR